MADEHDNGEDPNIELAPIKRGPGRPPKAVEPAPAGDVASQLSKVLAQAIGDVVKPKEAEIRLPTDRTEVRLKANRAFHVAAEHLAWSQVVGTAFGDDGIGKQVEPHDTIVLRPGPHVEWLLENGFARPEKAAAR